MVLKRVLSHYSPQEGIESPPESKKLRLEA